MICNYLMMLLKYPQTPRRKYNHFEDVCRNILIFTYCHLAGFYGFYICFTSAKWGTIFLAFFVYQVAAMGITAGAHRLWTHKLYKAQLPLQIILIIFNCFSFQDTVIDWIKDHRLYHKYSDVDDEPHCPSRAFFFSQFRWLMMRQNPLLVKRGKLVDMKDVFNNPVLRFQRKYVIAMNGMIGVLLPTVLPVYFWGESISNAWHIGMFRFITNLNETFLMNSAAHKYSYTSYDKNIKTDMAKILDVIWFGKGFLNYHHCFPLDYRAAEFGNSRINSTTMFINFFSWIGWAYDLKAVGEDSIRGAKGYTGIEDSKDKNGTRKHIDFADTNNNNT